MIFVLFFSVAFVRLLSFCPETRTDTPGQGGSGCSRQKQSEEAGWGRQVEIMRISLRCRKPIATSRPNISLREVPKQAGDLAAGSRESGTRSVLCQHRTGVL